MTETMIECESQQDKSYQSKLLKCSLESALRELQKVERDNQLRLDEALLEVKDLAERYCENHRKLSKQLSHERQLSQREITDRSRGWVATRREVAELQERVNRYVHDVYKACNRLEELNQPAGYTERQRLLEVIGSKRSSIAKMEVRIERLLNGGA